MRPDRGPRPYTRNYARSEACDRCSRQEPAARPFSGSVPLLPALCRSGPPTRGPRTKPKPSVPETPCKSRCCCRRPPNCYRGSSARTPKGPSFIHNSGMPSRGTPGELNFDCAWHKATFSSRGQPPQGVFHSLFKRLRVVEIDRHIRFRTAAGAAEHSGERQYDSFFHHIVSFQRFHRPVPDS